MDFSFDWGWNFDWSFVTVPVGPLAWFVFLLNAGAVYRLSRLVARDTISEPWRGRLAAKFHGPLVNLVQCMWCLSIWFGGLALFLTAWTTTRDLWLIVAYVLSCSAVGGYMSERA